MAVFLFVLALAGPLAAGQENYGAGSQAAPWLRLSNNARFTAMGEAGVATADDANAVGVNPAGLADLKGQQVSFMHHAYVLDQAVEHLAYGVQVNEALGLAASFDYLNFGKIDKYKLEDNALVADGSFTPTAYHLDLAGGYGFGSLSAGLSAKLVSESLDGSSAASTAAGDLGLLWKPRSIGPSLGLALQNLGGQLYGSNLPLSLRLGGAWGFAFEKGQAAVFALDAAVPTADSAATAFGLGGEFSTELGAVRLGYKAAGNGGASGLTAGAGLNVRMVRIDYAFSALGLLGNSNQVSALVKF